MSENKNLSRRDFLKVVGLAGGSAASVAAAAPKISVPAVIGKPFDGKTLRMHAISGANYDELYKLIPAW